MSVLRYLPALILLAVAIAAGNIGTSRAQSGFDSDFDHFTTGFRLEGAHLTADCQDCHAGAIFQGTPRDCGSCHSLGGRLQATAKSPGHVLSTDFCDDCHTSATWFPLAEMNHDAIFGSCSTCHNNVQAEGMPPGHVVTQLECEYCHQTFAWLPARFDHALVMPGTCTSCHNGTTAMGLPTGHIQTSAQCDTCHSTNFWSPATFDHAFVAPGTCSTCHNGSTATGTPAGHFMTSLACDDCHDTDFWSPAMLYLHTSAAYPGDHARNLQCTDCHLNNSDNVPYPSPAYAPDCAACHARDYRPGPHRNATVSQLRDCAGSCHQTRPEHRAGAREW